VPCDPAAYASSCTDGVTYQDCTPADGFLSGGECVIYPTSHSCSDVGCGDGSTNCEWANVVSQGVECVVAGTVLCDPATTPDSCQGSAAQTCIGYVVTTDCGPLGEICSVAG